ncbi:MAG: hypothetical protein J6X02_05130 [Bacilli bacterium]|nr:hypothetical protein [Bacilli bacterium]
MIIINIIFLDIDGVLNTSHFGMKDYKNKYGGYLIIDPEKLKILKRICDLTNSSIVLSTGWKSILDDDLKPLDINGKFLLEMFNEYDIPLVGKTRTIKKDLSDGRVLPFYKEYEIIDYLSNHPEILHFCIIDDKEEELESLLDYLIKTKDYQDNENEEGIRMEYLDDINKVLKKEIVR